ncbi:hypothetical protein Bint_0920 [Brachyspira intermedia PWS/A]|uniref:C2H2-type domain-containing protein n=1 Tax=Brachyspira intermedia (strain ATCC 51140 / PWS/A) TaxID=1045858 RepID=G0ELP5_BRAIP|nr:hypothetical protein [Brachyspira intermedia]AEM21545.1 hypothetical protein Bint_0920 [Brachyspira intermedia PWS/A]
MFPDKAPFHYKCRNCGYFFTTDKKLNAHSELSFVSLDFKDAEENEKDENVEKIFKIDSESKKESFIDKIFKKLSPKCPKCNEHAVVSVDYMVHK